jgi:nonribosomal peptide synthetase DhbF
LLAILDGFPTAGMKLSNDGKLEEQNGPGRASGAADPRSTKPANDPWQISVVMEKLRNEGYTEATLDEKYIAASIVVAKNSMRLSSKFVPRVFEGNLLFFASTHDKTLPSPDTWRPYVNGRIELHEVDCEHVDMLEPGALAKIGPILVGKLTRPSSPA